MNKYTAEFVEAEVEVAMSQGKHGTAAMFREFAALLRERESAKAGVTEEVAQAAYRAWCLANRYSSERDRMRSALEAVAPMLASARAKQEPYCYTVEQKNGLSQGAMCRTKAECEASPLFDTENDHVIPLYREPVMVIARVPELEKRLTAPVTKEELQRAWNMIGQAHPQKEWVERALIGFIELRLAAAPKPEAEE